MIGMHRPAVALFPNLTLQPSLRNLIPSGAFDHHSHPEEKIRMSDLTNMLVDTEELVVNWHVIKACNFRCGYCYADFAGAGPEIWKDPIRARGLIDSLIGLFSPDSPTNPLRSKLHYRSLRLSIAGGEPTLLGGKLVSILAHAKTRGLRTALITNGSRPDVIIKAARHVDVLTISIDSIKAATNSAIGRWDRKGNLVALDDVVAVVRCVREFRPEITIKINTVANETNAGEDLSSLIDAVRPDRWKIMRMLPIVTQQLKIDQQRFQGFIDRHQAFRSLLTVEDNSDMVDAYVMVDPRGRFFQNTSENADYMYSRPILEAGAEAAFREIEFDPRKFAARYATVSVV